MSEEMYQTMVGAGQGHLDCSAVVKVADGTIT